jgi:hypothetical protein
MKPSVELSSLAAAFGRLATDVKESQDKLLAYSQGLETIISEQTAELEHQRSTLEIRVSASLERQPCTSDSSACSLVSKDTHSD